MAGGFKGGEKKLSGRRSTPPARFHDGLSTAIESLKYDVQVWKEENDLTHAKDSRFI
jgi:hypothetical protein